MPADAQLVRHRINRGREAARDVAVLNLEFRQFQLRRVARAGVAHVEIGKIGLAGHVVEGRFEGAVQQQAVVGALGGVLRHGGGLLLFGQEAEVVGRKPRRPFLVALGIFESAEEQ